MKKIPQNAKEHLLSIYNKLFNGGYYPEQWIKDIVIAITKADKDPTECINYRPIALTS